MNVDLHGEFTGSAIARATATAIEDCVHCGFCLATCPTYLDSRDERDSPRGRIYLVRDLLESGASNSTARDHLDRCLTCRSCETTCPSGVRYASIADGGRELLEERVARHWRDRLQRSALLRVVPQRQLFRLLLRCAQGIRPLLPQSLRRKVPAKQRRLTVRGSTPEHAHGATVILFDGCVQSAATPRTNQAARGILDRLSISVIATPQQGCCGALATHLSQRERGLEAMRRNIDAWWPAIEAGASSVVSTATGCGSQIADYAQALAADSRYAAKAQRVSALAKDLSELLLEQPIDKLPRPERTAGTRVAVQVPCSQTHALGIQDSVRQLLAARGYTLTQTSDDHLCCGSAGSYSLLQPEMARRLRARKLDSLTGDGPDLIVSANIGCQLHLAETAEIPVMHWAELFLDSLDADSAADE